MSEDVTHTTARQTAITPVLGLGQTIAFASSFYLMGVLGDPIAADLHLEPAFVLSLVSLALAMAAVVSPRAGRWIDAHGGKVVLLVSNLVFAAALVTLALSRGPVLLSLGMLVLGVGLALGMYGTAFAVLVSLYGDEARRPITGVALLGGFGSAVGWPLTLYFEQTFGWRGACFAWAGLHLMCCLPMTAWIIPRVKGEGHGHTEDTPPEPVIWDRRMIQLAVLFACAWFVSTCMSTHLPRLLAAFGLSPAKAAATAGLVGIAAVSVRLAELTVLRRFAPLIATRVATLMHPLGAAGLLTLGAKGAPLLALGQGAGNGMITVAKGVLPLQLFGSKNYAYRSALLTRPAQIAQIGGPAVYGVALAQSPQIALALSAGLCLVMFTMTFGLEIHPLSQEKDVIT